MILDKHLKDNNITYFEHMNRSIVYGFKSLIASFYFFIHALLPFIFEHSGSDAIKDLSKNFIILDRD